MVQTVMSSVTFLASYILPFVFVLSIVVFFHELGHFLVGRWCGVKVDVFSIGFGPELFGFVDRKGTRWRFALLPLGGYVKFHGDANGASVPDPTAVAAMALPERSVTLAAQSVSKRAAIVAAGPIANFLLAIVIFSGIFMFVGRGLLVPRVQGVVAESAAAAAGFLPGDVIAAIDGRKIQSFNDMQRVVSGAANQTLTFTVIRDGREIVLVATPRQRDVVTPFGKNRVGQLGVEASTREEDWRVESYGPVAAVELAVHETWFVVERTVSYIGGLFVGRETPEQISGPIRIAQISGAMASVGLSALLNLAALLSVSIGLINLVPVPLLDGGHLLFYAIEALRGRPLSERAQEFGYRVGMALVAALMIFATFNDVTHLSGS